MDKSAGTAPASINGNWKPEIHDRFRSEAMAKLMVRMGPALMAGAVCRSASSPHLAHLRGVPSNRSCARIVICTPTRTQRKTSVTHTAPAPHFQRQCHRLQQRQEPTV